MTAARTPAFPRARVATVLMAAGAGKRLGGPKALLEWPSGRTVKPLAIAHADERLAAESGRVLVVTRKPIVASLLGHVRPGLDLLASDAADELGPAGSLAFAVARLGDDAIDVVIASPVDTPPAKAETVAALLDALAKDPELLAARPLFHGRTGHPVVLRAAALERYRAPDPPPLRDVLHAMGDACGAVEVADPTVLLDLDTPADVMGLLRTLPRFLK